ncbi:hypothetical protein CK203_116054 [Vitis vinifera]|uniref:Uncharacterized protein n=1 Tax=Vitis vinifera TaxID=29760 RepID=A0A438D0B6_VITVI|nr:hypothetical protein CK203_116054 [Vitis vinifera]
MNFMSYVAEISRGWDEPNARDMGRMTSQPNAKGEMYILNDDIDMKVKIATMARRLEELEMKKMQEVQAISQTPLQAIPCTICLSYEHLVDECPTIPAPPQYKQPAQAPQQASNLDQAMVNLSKVVGDFVGAQKSINAHLNQRIDSVESSLNKRMDEVQSDLSQKIDNLQYSISRFANLNKVQEKGNFPSQHYQNSKSIHEVETQKEESSMVKEVKTVITLSGKEVDLPTCKLEHKEESKQRKKRGRKLKERKGEKHRERRNCKEIEGKLFGARKSVKTGEKQGSAKFRSLKEASAKSALCCETISQPQQVRCEIATLLQNNFAAPHPPLRKFSQLRNTPLAHECHFAAQYPHFAAAKWLRNPQSVKSPIFAAKAPFRRVFRSCETTLGTQCHLEAPYTHFAAVKWLRNPPCLKILQRTHHEGNVTAAPLLDTIRSLPKVHFIHTISRFKAWEVRSP